jgi:hypothetical protein
MKKSQMSTYGLSFYCADMPGKIIKSVEDITVDKKKIQTLQDLIGKNDLSEIHIDDVVDDALVV